MRPALDAGLHVLCEKPLAPTAGQAKELYERAEAVGVKHMVYFTMRWLPPYRHLRRLLEEGWVGRPFQGHWRYAGGHGREAQYAWRFDRRRSAGVLGDLGSHMIDFARWQVGEISHVSSHLATLVERPGTDGQPLDPANDAATLLLRFENGAQGTIQLSAVAHMADRVQEQQVVLYGEAGTLEVWVSFAGMELRGAQRDEAQVHVLQIPDELWEGADHANPLSVFTTQPVGDRLFIEAILHDRPATPSFYDGFKAQQVVDAALASHESGCRVAVS